jgi:predicted nucleic acid-binding protein
MWRIFLDSSVLINYKYDKQKKSDLEFLIKRRKQEIKFISSKLLELEVLPLEKVSKIRKFYQLFFNQLAKSKTSIDDGTIIKALELRQKYILQPMDSLHFAGILNKQIKELSYKKPIYLFLTLDDGILTEGKVLDYRIIEDIKNKVIAMNFVFFMNYFVKDNLKDLKRLLKI